MRKTTHRYLIAIGGLLTALVAGALPAPVAARAATESPAGATDAPETPDVELDEPLSGTQAVTALGEDLEAVAASAGMTGPELRATLLDDGTLWVDEVGSLFYADAGMLPSPEPGPLPGAEPDGPPFPYEDTFTLHSRPGSTKVIYLDFTGGTITGTAWNNQDNGVSFDALAFSIDGDRSAFSNSEREVIQRVWQSVAEDFAPFDVDVTTEDPGQEAITRSGPTDDDYGTRVMVTDTPTIASTCNCGGIAYLGVFNATTSHARFQPAFVFTKDSKAAKFIAEAASHEAGHNLGLHHDGQKVKPALEYYGGHNGWAPIMGSGYRHPVTQWSKGEYSQASNKEDDVSVILGGGLTLLADDAGDKTTSAVFLGSTYPIERRGMITHAKDIDLYRINLGAGSVTVAADPAGYAPNLDIGLELLDSKGKAVAKANPAMSVASSTKANGLNASLTTTVAAGTYYVKISPAANGSKTSGYSTYGSLGSYTVTVAGVDGGGLPNLAPKAKIALASTTIGFPGPVRFSSSASTDLDGEIVAATWDFGDGSDAASGLEVTHSYTSAGKYTVTMTVTDDRGATATATAKVTTVPVVTVASVSVGSAPKPKGKVAGSANVQVVDADGHPVAGASVKVTWTTAGKKSSGSGKSGADGVATVKGPITVQGTASTATVTKVTKSKMSFNPDIATELSASGTL